jgi:hypothetical protein
MWSDGKKRAAALARWARARKAAAVEKLKG